MRPLSFLGFLALLLIAYELRADDAKDRQPLQGTWKIVSINTGGKTSELNLVLVIRADGMTLKQPDQPQKEQFKFVLDTNVMPKALDIHKADDHGKVAEKLFEGIYEVDGNDLRLCFAPQPGPPWNRPSSMTPKDDSRDVLVTFRRE